MKKETNIIVIAEKRMWTLLPMILYLLIDVILIFSLFSNWNTLCFWIVIIISVILFPMIFHKIFSPKIIISYDIQNKCLIINKMTKTIQIQLADIINYDANYKCNILIFRTKSKKRIILTGIKNIVKVTKKLDARVERNYSLFW